MLPSTVVGLFVIVIAVLPGLVYTVTFERQAGDYGTTFADRTLRFIAVSTVFHLIAGWLEYWVYRVTLGHRGPVLAGEFGLLWAAAAVVVTLPAIAGTAIGRAYGTRSTRGRWQRQALRLLLGPTVAPRAWDDLFSESQATYLRVQTTDGTMLAGLFASRSYAAGFPQDPDLLLEEAWRINAETGELEEPLGYPLYITAGQIAWIEIVPPRSE